MKQSARLKIEWLPCKIKIDSIWAQPKTDENKVRETVTLTMLNQGDDVPNGDVQFLMDTGAKCNVLPLTVYQKVTGDMDRKKLDKNKRSVLILANGYEQPIEGRAVMKVSRDSQTHKIVVNVVKGQGCEPILCKCYPFFNAKYNMFLIGIYCIT